MSLSLSDSKPPLSLTCEAKDVTTVIKEGSKAFPGNVSKQRRAAWRPGPGPLPALSPSLLLRCL